MMRIAALNDSSFESSNDEDAGPTLEALEADATSVYRKAISHLAKEEIQEAKSSFFEVLANPYIENAGWKEDTERPKTLPQDIALKYSCFKNVGNICMTEKAYDEAYKFYMKAVHLDSSEVTLWQKLGASAIKIKDFQLAVVAFQEGLLINPNHWPCLDQLLSVLFLLGFYEDCLGLAILTLQRDPHYLKALAFKDKIFELQPSLIDFAKEYFKNSDILFRKLTYDKTKGDKFINTCLELRPRQKEPRPPSPVVCKTVTKELHNFNWADLAAALKQTYDDVVNEDSKVFLAKLEVRSLIEDYIGMKTKADVKERLKSNLTTFFKAGRRLSRSLSYNDVALSKPSEGETLKTTEGERGASEGSHNLADKFGGPKRRQTIELGEGQESFRVGSRRSSSLESEGIAEVEMEDISPKDNEEQRNKEKIIDIQQKLHNVIDKTEERMESKSEFPIEMNKAPIDIPDMGQPPKTVIGTNQEKEKGTNVLKQVTNEEYISGKAQAAADQLKDIMAIKPSTEMLDIARFDEDFYEYFDGGVYEEEEEEEEEEDEEMESDEIPEQMQSDSGEKIEQEIEIIAECSAGVGDKFKGSNLKADLMEKDNAELNNVKKSKAGETEPNFSEGRAVSGGDLVQEENRKEISSIKDSANSSSTQPVAPKKPKRGKRGLERELEQLDYWGRRKAKEAKRRRQTLTSKLVGDFEDNEYLTWAHLIRSFIPASLLTVNGSAAKETSKSAEESDKESPTSQSLVSEKSSPEEDSKVTSEEMKSDLASSEKGEEDLKQTESEANFKFLEEFSGSLDVSQWNLEELEVGEFLYKSEKNGGVVDLMQRCQKELIQKYKSVWPLKCAVAYIDLYQRIRNHITVGATLSPKEDPLRLFNFANTTLIYIELLMSVNNLSLSQINYKEEPTYNLEQLLAAENSQLEDDLFDIQLLLGRPDVWNENYFQAHIRVGWIQAQIKLLTGLPEEGVFQLQMVLEQMILAQREDERSIKIERCRVEEDSLILSHSHIKNELNVLQRSQMLENIELKFKSGYYEEVVQILTSYFGDPKSKVNTDESSPPRRTQLLLLIESLVNLNDVQGVIKWGSLCLNDAVDNFHLNELVDEERNKWIHTIKLILLLVFEAVLEEPKEVAETPHNLIVKMICTLVNILVIQLELGSSLPEPYFSTLSPWIILHFILSQHEEEAQSKKNDLPNKNIDENLEDKDSENDAGVLPLPSTLLLITAHDELGKNGWCCLEDGKLLLYMMDALVLELQRPLSEEQKLVLHQAMEQIIFCLFAHPSRKTKVSLLYYKYRHLRDHGGQSIPLTFTRALQLYKYYLPTQFPEFQSEQFPSISDDVSVLFRRILSLTPDEYKYPDQIKKIEDYIEGRIEESQLVPLNFPQELKDCYYLLADNYFKGKEWEQAIHYYKLDVSINISRIDSWAPMGLAKKAQLETLLNSCEVIKSTEEFFKDAQRASRSLSRVLQLDQLFCNVWVEKGGLVYMIHSHASRLLNQDLNPDMSIEMFESLEKIKGNMLNEAFECFNEASKIVETAEDDDDLPDERWLYQYMLGKFAEKTLKKPKIVLTHYLDAMKRLHHMGATYPAKINYNSPSDYSVESLEVYFKVHVFIFKYLNQREGKDIEPSIIKIFKEIIDRLSYSPFVLGKQADINKESKDNKSLSSNKRPLTEIDELPSKKQKTEDSDVFDYLLNDQLKYHDDSENKKVSSVDSKEEKSTVSESNNLADKERENLVLKCIEAFELCINRFPHHYKSLYRIAYFYHNSKSHKDNNKARNILLGIDGSSNLSYMPSNGLFSERKISLMTPKNSNLFYGVWRIPHDEIDRPGSFAAHMYKCVSLCLDILHETKDFYTVLEIAISLRHSPDKDKKYLRDNERELLFEHSTQVGIQTMKDKFRLLFKSSTPISNPKCHSFIIDVYKAYKQMGKYLPVSESPFSKMLIEAFTIFKNISSDSSINVLREAEKYCIGKTSTMMDTAVNPNIHYQSNMRNIVPPPPSIPGVVRRGRPPGPSRDFGTFRFRAPQENKSTMGQSVAVQQAYKVYENLIHAQTILNNKNLDEKSQHYYQGKHEEYKQQMLKYLQIPSVSQFFHSSLQSLGTAASKLPPPPSVNHPVIIRNISPPPTVSSKPSTAPPTIPLKSSIVPSTVSVKPSTALSSVSVKPSTAPSSVSVKPSTAPSSVSVKPSTALSSVSVKPSTAPSSVSVKPSTASSSVSVKPSTAPSSVSVKPSTALSSVSVKPSTAPSSVSVKPSTAPSSVSVKPSTAPSSVSSKSSAASQGKPSINSLAERSKAHGISISAVSTKKAEPALTKPVKPSMSITLSQSKLNSNTSNKISVVNLEKSPPKTNVNTGSANLPKLPPGTTLSRQIDQPSNVSQKPFTKDTDASKAKSLATLASTIASKGSVTITHAKPSDTPTTKKQSNVSFQAVFQASLVKPKIDITNVNTKDPIISPTLQQLQKGIKLSSLKYLKNADPKRWENEKTVASTSTTNLSTTTTTSSPATSTKVMEHKSSKPFIPKPQTDKKKPTSSEDKEKDAYVITLD